MHPNYYTPINSMHQIPPRTFPEVPAQHSNDDHNQATRGMMRVVGGATPETQKLCALHEAVVGVMGHARERNGSSDTHAVLGSG